MSYYGITISPKYRLKDPKTLFVLDENEITRVMNRFSKRYCLYPEFDSKSRLHYHGIALVHDHIKMHRSKYEIDTMIGLCKFDKLHSFKDRLRYLTYSMKEYADTRRVLKKQIRYRNRRRKKKIQKGLHAKKLDKNILKKSTSPLTTACKRVTAPSSKFIINFDV